MARPIGLAEFTDALRATCKPRFPEAMSHNQRLVGMAISGGVDSMALAYLCSKVREVDPLFMVCDNPVATFRGFVIDHGLRQESAQEAEQACKAIRRMGLSANVFAINWRKEFGEGADPKTMPNFESAARRARYRRLGKCCVNHRIATLLLGHHQDDQYETVLMRLLNGHRNRALRGMRRASAIPECDGIHGAFNSGWVDDQDAEFPYINYKPGRVSRKHLKHELVDAIRTQMTGDDGGDESLVNPWVADEVEHVDEYGYLTEEVEQLSMPLDLELPSMAIEDAGVNIYRPMLDFGKDRLIATCLANDVPWWEDRTNADPTLTTRNTLRDLARTEKLPAALRKPAVLALSVRCEFKARAQDAEVDRWLKRTILHEFEPHAGSLVVQFPDLAPAEQLRHRSLKRYHRRIVQKRAIAGLLVQRIVAIVSPDIQHPPLANLQNVVSRLFPSLAGPSEYQSGTPPKPFPIASVHFTPLETTPPSSAATVAAEERTWYVSRLPYTSTAPLPQWRIPYWSAIRDHKELGKDAVPEHFKWSMGLPWHLYDGRYWIRITHCLPYRVAVMPFLLEHAKAFRESLGRDEAKRLNTVLKRLAPGKVRFTLPAIYVEEYLDLDNVVPRPNYPEPADEDGDSMPEDTEEIRAAKRRNGGPTLSPVVTSKMRLLALPTLGVQLPGLEKWLRYETRYKRVDRDTLYHAGTFSRGSFVAPVGFGKRAAVTARSVRGRSNRGRASLR
ncbi:PP-loop family protein [Apiospora marii]|uniref:PP-loop family protein n=1 Tax=Apiospora marii TaxID=335849 RepID=UPI00312FFE52